MSQEEDFDAFYRDTRFSIAHQVFCHTGDLTAAQSATRDAYEVTWQHWRKVQRRQLQTGEDPLSYVRPLAYRLAVRRHVGRVWHRRNSLTSEHRETLDALDRLGSAERRLLLLTTIGGLPLRNAAREVSLTHQAAERRLARADERLRTSLGEEYVARLQDLAEPADRARLPRPSAVMRSGRKRRRVTAVTGVAAVLAVTVISGALAREPGMDRASALHQIVPGGDPVGLELPAGLSLTKPAQLLQAADLGELTPEQTWRVGRTDTNTSGDGLNAVCQQSRFADPRAVTGMVRTFEVTSGVARSALQAVEISRDSAAAQAAYSRAVGWYSGCSLNGFQFQSAHELQGLGDEAQLLQVKVSGASDVSNYDIALVRVGEILTSLVIRTAGGASPDPQNVAEAMAATVARLCPPARASCGSDVSVVAIPPPPSTEESGFLSTVDLPLVTGVADSWVGVPSVAVGPGEDSTTRCDRADFIDAGANPVRSRTYVIPQADLPDTFGFTETYAVFPDEEAAKAYYTLLKQRMNECEDSERTVSVSKEQKQNVQGSHSASVWQVENEVQAKQSVTFRVGFVRSGSMIAKLSLVPAEGSDMTDADFLWLTRRAAERLSELS